MANSEPDEREGLEDAGADDLELDEEQSELIRGGQGTDVQPWTTTHGH